MHSQLPARSDRADIARRLYWVVIVGALAQVLLIVGSFLVTDRSFRVTEQAREFERASMQQRSVLQGIGLLTRRLETELDKERANPRIIARVQRRLDRQNQALVESVERAFVHAEAFGIFASAEHQSSRDETRELLSTLHETVGDLTRLSPSELSRTLRGPNNVAVIAAPNGRLVRTFTMIAEESERLATERVARQRIQSAALQGALLVVLLAVAILLVRPALLRQAAAIERETLLNAELRRQSVTDPLTGLYNRQGLDQALRDSAASRSPFAVAMIDLDKFKPINDTFGHAAGDAVLKALAERLRATVREGEIVARVGGDEFVVVLNGVDDTAEARRVANRLARVFERSVPFEDHHLDFDGSIGIALARDSDGDVGTLMRNADFALYEVKGDRQRRVSVHEVEAAAPFRDPEARDAIILALDAGQIGPLFQPKVRLADGAVIGCEALAHWEHPERGGLATEDFLPLIDQSRLHPALLRVILEQALDTLRHWERTRQPLFGIAVDLTEPVLADPDTVSTLSALPDTRPELVDRLTFEITEDVFTARSSATIISAVNRLTERGLRFSMDDFGTGYGSLRHLREIAVQEIKIDRGFVAGIGRDATSEVIVQSFIATAHGLGAIAVAEGVETLDQADFLRTIGCDQAQGFLYAPALTAADLQTWAATRSESGECRFGRTA